MLKFCPYCGSKILKQDVAFCMECGKSLAAFMAVTETPESPPAQKVTPAQKPPVTPKKSAPARKAGNSPIEQELKKCRQSAEEGFQLASANYDEIKDTLTEEASNLSKTDSEQNEIQRIQNTELVETQKRELKQLADKIKLIDDDIKNLHARAKDFSIIVYGRTMAGKSTLMEILTHGNGKSIGKGAQRTTLDVRDYYWNGLKITDVPGICAFGGAEDERLALEAAKTADLILFLLTSDAPQPDEATCLAQLKSFGKPILGVINVKMSFNINDELDIEDLQEKLADTSTIDATLNQFKDFAASHNQDWSGIKFVATHLLSAYQSQDTNPKVFEISRFSEVEDFILDKVRNDGRFLRIKTFADSIAVPMNDIILKIYEHSATTLLESDVWFDKRRQLTEWREKFLARSQEKINRLYDQLSEQLDNAIYNFAESHYEDNQVNEHWQQRLQSLHFDQQYQELLKNFASECERKRKELSDELTQELSYAFHGNTSTSIELEGTTPWGKYAAMVLPNLLLFVPGIGWGARIAISIGSAIFSFLFEDKQEKIREAKAKLREDLTPPSYEMLGKMHSQVVDIFNDEILAKGIDEFSNLLCGYQFMLARLGQSQSILASKLFVKFNDLNVKLLQEAIAYKNAGSFSSLDGIARVPGETMLVFANGAKLNTAELSDLLGEKISVMQLEENLPDVVKNILGCDFNVDSYPTDFTKENEEPQNAVAVIPQKKVNATNLKLAQQIAGVPIIVDTFKRDYSNRTTSSTAQTNRKPKTNSGGNTSAYNSGTSFEKIDDMIADLEDTKIIINEIYGIECKARYKRDAALMNKVADYYQKVGEHVRAFNCREDAKIF